MAGQCVQSLSELSRMFAHQFAVICGVRDNNERGGEGVVALQARRHYRDVSSEHERRQRHVSWVHSVCASVLSPCADILSPRTSP